MAFHVSVWAQSHERTCQSCQSKLSAYSVRSEYTFCPPVTSSSPAERAFSHGGSFVRPHRAQISNSLLCQLMLAKCNCMTVMCLDMGVFVSETMSRLQHWIFWALITRRPVSADRTACRQLRATGQPVNRTQASDAITSRLSRYEAKCVQRRCFQWGRSLCVQISRERNYPLPTY